jgi:hypothetical protein
LSSLNFSGISQVIRLRRARAAFVITFSFVWIVDAHREGKRFVVRAEEKLTTFLELEGAVRRLEAGPGLCAKWSVHSGTDVDTERWESTASWIGRRGSSN